ncbi:hypothetical protein HJC23_000910 [Cyclotella cryptica]|uniref:Uncharacterized protein n=1 Tax=Cyclotella cryptica TaxID=29204 RepID=A0ABD3QMX8_9STRA
MLHQHRSRNAAIWSVSYSPRMRKKTKSPVDDGELDGIKAEHIQINAKEEIMKHYRTPAEILKSPQLPDWVKQYTRWHKKQRQRYLEAIKNNSTADDIRFLISRCLINDHCGGASDRLQDMPYNLMIANQTQRVLLIKWEKPALLEHYLVPPEGGIDWTIFDGMFKDGENWHLKGKEIGQDRIVSTIRRDSAAPIFRKYENEEVGHKILLFTPSAELSDRFTTKMTELELFPSMYSSVHLRVKYPVGGINEHTFSFERYKSKIIGWANNAVNCAAELHPNATIYVTADNNDTVGYLLEDSPFAKHYRDATKNNRTPLIKLVARDYSIENEHVAFSTNTEADGFMGVFEDIMIMGLGKCVSHGLGGFGRLGAALSGAVCAIAHRGKYSTICRDLLASTDTAPAFEASTFKKMKKIENRAN